MILITGKKYDILKELALVWLPALGAAYFALAGIWDLPSAEQVTGTVLVVDTFIGGILHLSSSAYAKSDDRFDGAINVGEQTDEVGNFTLSLPLSAEQVLNADQVVLKVNKGSTPPTK